MEMMILKHGKRGPFWLDSCTTDRGGDGGGGGNLLIFSFYVFTTDCRGCKHVGTVASDGAKCYRGGTGTEEDVVMT